MWPFASFLFAPADQPRKLGHAWRSSASAVIADLEDAVLDERKGEARETLSGHLCGARARPNVVVRINGTDTVHAEEDIAVVRSAPGIAAILVPKADVRSLSALPSDVSPIVALVGTPAGVLSAPAVAELPGVAYGLTAATQKACVPRRWRRAGWASARRHASTPRRSRWCTRSSVPVTTTWPGRGACSPRATRGAGRSPWRGASGRPPGRRTCTAPA